MRIDLITVFPEWFESVVNLGVVGRAVRAQQVQVKCWNPRDYTLDRHRTVDDRPYGGGPGMVMTIDPLRGAIRDARQWIEAGSASHCKVIYLSPQGRLFNQQAAQTLTEQVEEIGLILVCGRYEGVDERLIELEVDEEWSIGDYVLSGGELPAMVLLDAVIRQLPGALGHQDSANQDSFAEGAEGAEGLLDCPHYTRPENYEGLEVPSVLMSGNHEKIRQWRQEQSLARTRQRRPDLLKKTD